MGPTMMGGAESRTKRARRRRPARLALLLAAAWLLGCSRERPWNGPTDGGSHDESQPWLPARPDASWLSDAGTEPTASAAQTAESKPSPVGGLWVSCYGGFVPSGDPRRDVTRLALLCGPPNGMRPVSDELFEGKVEQGGAPSTHRFPARRGECYRIFAVADAGVADLDVAVRSSRGSRLARDHSEDRWPVVHPERPFCTFDDDTFAVHLGARRGTGRYAAQVWKLPARK